MLKLVKRGPNIIHPEKMSAVGSRNSLMRDDRNEYEESRLVVDEEVDKILNHISSKLPPEVLEKLDVQGNIKEKLHNYYNQGMQNMLNRYLTTVEDELGKKYRDLIDKEEARSIARYSPRTIAEMIDSIAGENKFNTGEIEQSIINIYGHLQGSIQRGVNDLENKTNSLLRQKTDVGALIRGENAYAVSKCSFRNDLNKPETVYNAVLSINVLESELISPIYFHNAPIVNLLKNLIHEHAHELIDREIEKLTEELIDKGENELSSNEIIFEKFKLLDNYFSDDESDNSKRYSLVSKKMLDSLEGIFAEIPVDEKDALNLRDLVKKMVDDNNIKNRGFNTAVNNLTNILDTSKMGYQFINNYKNRRKCVINEYSLKNGAELPDENYQIDISYNDAPILAEMRKAYQLQYDELIRTTREIEEIFMKVLEKSNRKKGLMTYQQLEEHYLGKETGSGEEEMEDEKHWNELSFIKPKPGTVENAHNNFLTENEEIRKRIKKMRFVIYQVFGKTAPVERDLIADKLDFLESAFLEYSSKVNPFHVQPGLLLTIKVSTVKRKSTTLYSIANVLNEFLNSISSGFADKAFAQFSRRRSTVRDDFEGEFISVTGNKSEEEGAEQKQPASAS